MKKSLLALAAALAATAIPSVSFADGLSFNVGAVTDYRYRGISQTRAKPALQGGLDYSAGGFYVGAWGSTIQWLKDAGGDADLELDFYGGYKFEPTKGLTVDLGVLRYQYPSHKVAPSPNTTELYGAVTYGPVTAKYSHATSNLFGFADSSGSGYFDLSAGFEVAGFTVTPHIGHQKVKNVAGASYTDYSLAVSKDFNGLVVSGTIVGTDTDAYTSPKNGKNLGKTTLVLGVKYNF